MKKLMVLTVLMGMHGLVNAALCGGDPKMTKHPSNPDIAATVAALQAKVGVHGDLLTAHGSDLAKVGPAVEELGRKIDSLAGNLLTVQASIKAIAEGMVGQNDRIAQVEIVVAKSESTAVAAQVDGHEKRLLGHDEALKAHDKDLATLYRRVNRLVCVVGAVFAAVAVLTCEEVREAAGSLPFFKR